MMVAMTSTNALIPSRPLGRTGHDVTILGLGGEGVLRTHGRMAEAVAVIHQALDEGVNYCDTAPAYATLGLQDRDLHHVAFGLWRTGGSCIRGVRLVCWNQLTGGIEWWQLVDRSLPARYGLDRISSSWMFAHD